MDRLNIINEKWDHLIVLDACRYDYFQKVYADYLTGKLEKKLSIGVCTSQWRDRSFPDRYDDIVYITANPLISADTAAYNYTAGKHFHKVHDVWKTRWDEQRGTVAPDALTDAALEIIKNTPGKRFIIHYLQPHAPYLSADADSEGFASGAAFADTSQSLQKQEIKAGIRTGFINRLSPLLKHCKILGNQPDWHLRKVFALPPKKPIELAWRRMGKRGLQSAYLQNLELVLQQVAILLKYLAGRIVITSDHGELLGEKRQYGHPTWSKDPILKEVPWLIIDKEQADIDISSYESKDQDVDKRSAPPTPGSEDEQEQLAEKLRALGYYD